jgi:hypothetical protein
VSQRSFIAGAGSLNEQDLHDNLAYFKVPQAGFESTRSKLVFKIFDEYSGKHKIVSSGSYEPLDFCSGKKKVMSKKKVFAARNLKDCIPNLPLKRGKAEKKIKVFLSRQFCASLKYANILKGMYSTRFNGRPRDHGTQDQMDPAPGGPIPPLITSLQAWQHNNIRRPKEKEKKGVG